MDESRKHTRRSIRLADYDYSQEGAYFITICSHQRKHLFGEIVDGEMISNKWGDIVQDEWIHTGELRKTVELDMFVVMPNHVHCILLIVTADKITSPSGTVHRALASNPIPTKKRAFGKSVKQSLPTIIGAFKGAVTRQINRLPQPPGHPIWQRNYYEHIIRTEKSLNQLRDYVLYNPARWEADSLYSDE